MERRLLIRIGAVALCGGFAHGCKARLRSYDSPPKRGLLEDRWPGYIFDSVSARYALRLTHPASSLSRPSGLDIPILSGNAATPKSIPDQPVIRPEVAIVELEYSTQPGMDSQVTVTVRWPRNDTLSVNQRFMTEESMTALIGFDDIRQFIDGTGRFRCDRDDHFYGVGDNKDNRRRSEYAVDVELSISGPNPDSCFQGVVKYKDEISLYRIGKIACPGLG